MCNIRTKVIPVIIGTSGTISKSYRKYLGNTPGKARNQGTTKNSHIGHCTHTAESANKKVQNIFHGRNTLHVAQTANTEQLQHYIS